MIHVCQIRLEMVRRDRFGVRWCEGGCVMPKWLGRLAVLMVGVAVLGSGCEKRSKVDVELRYVEAPAAALPTNLESIAFIPFTQAVEDADRVYTARERRWGDQVIGAVAATMEDRARQMNLPLKIVDREAVASIMKEKDLADAGLAEENKALELGKLAKAQAICYGKVAINIETQKGKSSTIEFRRSADGVRPYTAAKTRIKRTMTVAVTIKIVAVATGRSITTFHRTLSDTVESKPSAFMGKDAQEIDLEPENEGIAKLIGTIVKQFADRIMPREVVVGVRLANPKNKRAEEAGRMVLLGDYAHAIELYRDCLKEEPQDHAAWFNLGVAQEASGDLDAAAQSYRRAFSISDKKEYLEAYDRVKRRQGKDES